MEALHRAAARNQRADNIAFYAIVHECNFHSAVTVNIAAAHADFRHAGLQLICCNFLFHSLCIHIVAVRNHAAHGAAFTKQAGQCTCVNSLQTRHMVRFQIGIQINITAEIACHIRNRTYNVSTQPRFSGLCILIANAIVANHRVRHDNTLSRIRRISQQFRVSAHGTVEYNLAQDIVLIAKSGSSKCRAIFKHQQCFHEITSHFFSILSCRISVQVKVHSFRCPLAIV